MFFIFFLFFNLAHASLHTDETETTTLHPLFNKTVDQQELRMLDTESTSTTITIPPTTAPSNKLESDHQKLIPHKNKNRVSYSWHNAKRAAGSCLKNCGKSCIAWFEDGCESFSRKKACATICGIIGILFIVILSTAIHLQKDQNPYNSTSIMP